MSANDANSRPEPGTLAIPQHAPTARQPSPSTSYHNPFDAQAPGSAYSGGRARQRQLYQVTASEALGQSRSPSPESRQPEDPSSSLIPPAAHRLVPLTNRTQAKDSSRQNPFGRTTSPPLATRTTTMPTSGRRVAFSASAPWQSFNDIRTERGRTWKLLLTYGGDWVLTIGLTAAFFMLDGVEGFKREFDLNDTSIQHTYAVHERVPNWLLVVICFAAPITLMPLINLASVRSWWDWHNSSLGLVLALGLTGTITNVVKICVGRPRPDVIDRCQPVEGSQNSPVFGLSNYTICTQTDAYILRDGFRSFPSGHSSLSFCGLGFLSFYLAGKLHLFDERGHTGKAWISVTPLVGAALTAVSRTMDYRHHWQDVTVGSLLGLTVAYFSYRQFYPPLYSPKSHKPYSPRIPREPATVLPTYGHRRDISESQIPLTGNDDGSPHHAGAVEIQYPPVQPHISHQGGFEHRQYSAPVNYVPFDEQQSHNGHLRTESDPFADGRDRSVSPQPVRGRERTLV